jgi:hypothetical protein
MSKAVEMERASIRYAIEAKIRHLEKLAYFKSARFGVWEKFAELVLMFINGLRSPDYRGSNLVCSFNTKAIKRYYDKKFSSDSEFGIRDGDIRIANRAVAKQIFLNILQLEFSPSIAIYRAWQKSNGSFDEFHYATDHPQIYAFILAIRDKCRIMHYYQHGWYPEREFWFQFAEYDVAHTIFDSSYEYLTVLNKEKKVIKHSMLTIPKPDNKQKPNNILLVLPEFRYANGFRDLYFNHTCRVIEYVISIHGKKDLYIRFHPLDNGFKSKYTKAIIQYGLGVLDGPLDEVLSAISIAYLVVPSTFKYEAEASGVKVIIKPISQTLSPYPLLF